MLCLPVFVYTCVCVCVCVGGWVFRRGRWAALHLQSTAGIVKSHRSKRDEAIAMHSTLVLSELPICLFAYVYLSFANEYLKYTYTHSHTYTYIHPLADRPKPILFCALSKLQLS